MQLNVISLWIGKYTQFDKILGILFKFWQIGHDSDFWYGLRTLKSDAKTMLVSNVEHLCQICIENTIANTVWKNK